MKIKTTYWLALISLFFACEKKEIPLPPHQPGTYERVVIPIGYPYNNQVFYNCNTNKIVSSNKKYDWDLAFDCAENGYVIRLNTAKGMLAASTNSTIFDSIYNINNLVWQWDQSDGNKNYTALGNWFQISNGTPSNIVYIINRQFNENGNSLGYKKVIFTGLQNDVYSFKYSDLNGQNEHFFQIKKDKNYNHVYFSFNNGGEQVTIEPPKTEWDLLFTNYQHKFAELEMPFVITGCLINSNNGVEAAKDSLRNFYEIKLNDINLFSFSNEWDKIGYDWKIRNNQDNSFTIHPKLFYLVKSHNGIYFKIKFIDFYNSSGEKGYPTFEIQRL
ncbi:MAG: hypothetical protein HND27_08550 [Bacteroidetes bacterium]|nr:hypothetical protein [Bacteroidota bacterium]MBV6460395.1 hypothetical protein [Flavobacteriales bacterium]WKZ74762.1 MAG: HmuY family protein [Vicingaceae bacterium]MCL4815737.1 HmuY family protein [Flavobacteriales bacterium]NOG95815.1 hypothetical protein [Bacteroidota bacterium]